MIRVGLIAIALLGCGSADKMSAATGASASQSASDKENAFPPTRAFRAHAAKLLKVPVEQITGGLQSERSATYNPHTRGRAWAIEVYTETDPPRSIVGWVTPDSVVVTAHHNLGVLLAESGLWNKSPKGDSMELTTQIVNDIIWSYGNGARPEGYDPIEWAPDGSGKLGFTINDYHGAYAYGRGGGGAPMDRYFDAVVTFTADHKATLDVQLRANQKL